MTEEIEQVWFQKIDHGKATEPESDDAKETDTTVKIKNYVAIIPPFQVFEGFEIPAREIFK